MKDGAAVVGMIALVAAGMAACRGEGIVLPDRAGLWRAEGPAKTYDRRTLYDYIDGSAEVYLAYGFRKLTTRRYVCEGQPAIAADVFDMGSPADAYGIFSFERMGGHVGLGDGSEYGGGMLRFWQGRYFVCVSAPKETEAVKQATLQLGRRISAALPKPGFGPPKIVSLLPSQGLRTDRVRYFHQHGSLNYHYFLSTENILNLGTDTEAALAQYEIGDAKARLLLVRYPSQERAQEAMESLRASYLEGAGTGGLVQLEDGKWAGARQRGVYLVVVLEASDRSLAERLMQESIKRLRG
ncbi:MAG: hypothetical protein N2512_07835 [Armatimonadetes bacterium]|nr:hypothetical protein [Armatimonadota bacterium]